MKFTLGVCAMETKVESSPMKSILKHLEDSGDFIIIIFPERMILDEPITKWPVVECLIAFYSLKFPLEKAIEYVKLVKPIILNDLEKQRIIRSRINVYRELQACRIPHPNYLLVDHEMVKKGLHTFEEHYDYIVYNNVRLNKPFIEKPIDSDDHNNWIYYPSNAGGGCKKLFRKVHDRSSKYCPDIHNVRRNGTYIYEEFMLTYGTDIKVYAVGSMFAHAEARKSPTLDGKVNRYSDGKEYRYPVILTSEEKTIAYRIVDHFGQTVCGFDILRTFDGPYVCDVNGWSFVKRNKKYHIDCSQIIRAIFLLKLQSKFNIPLDCVLQSKPKGHSPIGTGIGEVLTDRNTYNKPHDELEASGADEALVDESGNKVVERLERRLRDASKTIKNKSREELCSVIVVMRHADRKPKNKLKFFTKQKEILNYFKGNESEIKLKSTEELSKLNQVNDQIILDLEERLSLMNSKSVSIDSLTLVGDCSRVPGINMRGMGGDSCDMGANRAATSCVAAINRANSCSSGMNDLLVELNYHKEFQRVLKKGYEFLGINRKVQLKAVYKPKSVLNKHKSDENELTRGGGTERESPSRQIEKVLVVAKWGGDLTDVGKSQAEDLGRRLRQTLYPADSSALIRLHSTYRHDFKIFSSDEGRCQITGAAFTKGILDLEGELTPILVAMTIRNKKAYQLLNETVISEERAKCRYKLDELITHHGTPEYDEILQDLPEYERYYYSKALEDADFSQDDLVNLSNLIRYYISTLNKEKMMWNSLYSVDDYAFNIVNKLNAVQTRWTQLLLKFHRPACGGLSRANSGAFYKSQRGPSKINTRLLDRIYGDNSSIELDTIYGANALDPNYSKSNNYNSSASKLGFVSELMSGDNHYKKLTGVGRHASEGCNGEVSGQGYLAVGNINYRDSFSSQSDSNYSSTLNSNNEEVVLGPGDGKGGRSSFSTPRIFFRDDEIHSSDYCPEERYDYTKLSDIVDNIRYDLIHLHHLLGRALEIAFEIYRIVERLSSVISPCEYGVTPMEKLQIGAKIAWNLLKKIQHDVSHQRVRMSPYTDQENAVTGSNVSLVSLSGTSSINQPNMVTVDSTVKGPVSSLVTSIKDAQRCSIGSINDGTLTTGNLADDQGNTLKSSDATYHGSSNNVQTDNLNVSAGLEHLDYDIDFMVNNDTSAASIAVNSLASSGTYLDSNKIFEEGKCFFGGIRPTEMYLFSSSTRTEILWTSISGTNGVDATPNGAGHLHRESVGNLEDGSFVTGRNIANGSIVGNVDGSSSMTDNHSNSSGNCSSNSSVNGSANESDGTDDVCDSVDEALGDKSKTNGTVNISKGISDTHDKSVLLNSYSLWLHISPSNSMENISVSSTKDSKTKTTNKNDTDDASENNVSSATTKTVSGSTTNTINPNTTFTVITEPNRATAYSILSTTGKVVGKNGTNDPEGRCDVVNPMEQNQGWGWDEKIFDDLIRLGTNEDLGIRSQQRVVRSRYYVTSASHMFSVFNFFKYAHLLDDSFDTNLKNIENINDLHYLSHIVLRVWRSRSSEGFFNRLEILVSSGAKDGFGQNLSLLEQSAKNQKNKYKRHIQRYKLRTLQSSNCSHCPILLTRRGLSGLSEGAASSFEADVHVTSTPNTRNDAITTDGCTNVATDDNNMGSKTFVHNKDFTRLSSKDKATSTTYGISRSCSHIVDKYNLMVNNVVDKKFKCFKCFIEQYKLSEVNSTLASPLEPATTDPAHKSDVTGGSKLINTNTPGSAYSHSSALENFGDTTRSCASGVGAREDDALSNKSVPPYCELNNLVVMNRNFGLDRLNNLIQKTYEEIISKG